jgi:hypothetical protein
MAASALLRARSAPAATLPNELPHPDIAVEARGACGPFFRPGAWTALRVTVGNSGNAFTASVRVREARGGRETHYIAARRVELRRGPNPFDVLVAPGDPSAGTALEIVRLRDDLAERDAGEVVFRSALSRVLRPLARGERLFVTVGEMPIPVRGGEHARVWALGSRELPTIQEAYGSVDALVIGSARRSAVSRAQVRAAGQYVLGGGRIAFASLRALDAFAPVLSNADARAPQSLSELRAALPAARVSAGTDADPRVVEFHLGLGRCAVVAAGPGETPPWLAAEFERLLGGARADPFLGPPRAGAFVDTAAFGALEVDRPFARGAMRARTVAIVGALLVTVCAALMAKKSRRVAGGVLGAATVAWTVVALLAWREPLAAARVVRVRAFSADGRAEAAADTAMLTAFDGEVTLAFETDAAPPLPVARRPGEAFAESFVLGKSEGDAGAWRISSLNVYPGEPFIVRATSTREVGPDAEALRKHALAEGARVKVITLPGGGRKLSAGGEFPRDMRYLLERFAPRCSELAWVWVEGAPEGARAPGCDTSPGSGTLVIAGVPTAGTPR